MNVTRHLIVQHQRHLIDQGKAVLQKPQGSVQNNAPCQYGLPNP